MSETINLHQAPETMTLHRALWAGQIMSAFVVVALLADGAVQLFAPAHPRLRHPLRHPGHLRPRRDPGDWLSGRRHLRPCPHW